jgi:hypothetical protein
MQRRQGPEDVKLAKKGVLPPPERVGRNPALLTDLLLSPLTRS